MTDQSDYNGVSMSATPVDPAGKPIELSDEELQNMQDAAEKAAKKRKDQIEELMMQLVSKRDACIRARRDIERRWIDDQRQWDGEGRLLNTKEFPSQTNDDKMKPPRPHLTRARCDIWESRMVDLLAPTNEPTWELAPLCQEDLSPPNGVALSDWMVKIQADRDDQIMRAHKMRDVIQDQLSACNGTKVIRRMCRDACRLGTGLVMGPMNGTHIRWKPSNDPSNPVNVIAEETTIPEIREGDPWCFYPDMTSSADKASYAFYLHPMDEVELWNFSQFSGVDKVEVDAVMDEKPDFGEVETTMKERNAYSGLKESIENRHAVWRYTGIIDRRYCEVLNFPKTDGPICADIWFCNTHILKAKLTMLSTVKDFRIPYYVYAPFPIDDTMFGASVAYLCRDSQRTADASWLMGLYNLSVSSGPQIVIRKGKVVPADGKYSVRGPKIWYVTDDQVDIDKCFASENIQNNAQQAFDCFNMAKQLMDEELNTLQWASPDTSEVTETASGLAMLMNARTILQRRVCAAADDEVFQPMIQRFVLWNLLYNKRPDIKGEYDVRPLCQSVRLVKDIRIQQKLFVADNLAQNPMFASVFNPYDMISDITRDLDVHVENWLKPKQQWMQEQQQLQQQQQQNPELAARLAAAQSTQQLNFAKTQTEQLKQQKMHAEILQGPQQADMSGQQALFITPDMQAKLKMHAVEQQVALAKSATDAETQKYVAAANLQAKREQTAATLHQAAQRNRHDLIKSGIQAKTQIQTAKMKASQPGKQPKGATGKFTPPKTPPYHRGRG